MIFVWFESTKWFVLVINPNLVSWELGSVFGAYFNRNKSHYIKYDSSKCLLHNRLSIVPAGSMIIHVWFQWRLQSTCMQISPKEQIDHYRIGLKRLVETIQGWDYINRNNQNFAIFTHWVILRVSHSKKRSNITKVHMLVKQS